MNLKDEFDNFYISNFGSIELDPPLFYNFPIGIRYEIGTGDLYKNYVKNAIYRANNIFTQLFNIEDELFLIFDNYKNENEINCSYKSNASIVHQLIDSYSDKYIYQILSPKYKLNQERHIIKTTVKYVRISKLIEEIIMSDLNGINSLASCVYLFNKRNGIIYYLYDDRGLDIIANDTSKLIAIYQKFNNWILDYDRVKIDKIFNKK